MNSGDHPIPPSKKRFDKKSLKFKNTKTFTPNPLLSENPISSSNFPSNTPSTSPDFQTLVPDDPLNPQRSRLLFVLSLFTGTQVLLSLQSGKYCKGILSGVDTQGNLDVILKYAHLFENLDSLTTPKLNSRPLDSLLIPFDDIFDISAVVDFDLTSKIKEKNTKFQIDSNISKSSNFKERPLFKWDPDSLGDDPSHSFLSPQNPHIDLELESDTLDRPWDQFAANEKLFGLTSNFDELLYTTKIDKNRSDFKQREREAIRIANEIQFAPAITSHVLEERNILPSHDDLDEEDRYGAVIRQMQKNEKYISPYLRSKANKMSAHKQNSSISSLSQSQSTPAPQNLVPAVNDKIDSPLDTNDSINNGMSVSKAAQALAKLNIKTIQSTGSFQNSSEIQITHSSTTINPSPFLSPENLAPQTHILSSDNTSASDIFFPPAPVSSLKHEPSTNKQPPLKSSEVPISNPQSSRSNSRAEKAKNIPSKSSSKNSLKHTNSSIDLKEQRNKPTNMTTPNNSKKPSNDTKSALNNVSKYSLNNKKDEPVNLPPDSSSLNHSKPGNNKSPPTKPVTSTTKLNVKAPLFIPNPKAPAYIPNSFFGSRKIDKKPMKLWGEFLAFNSFTPIDSSDKIAPTWPSNCGVSYLRLITAPKISSSFQTQIQPQIMNPVNAPMYNNLQYPQIVVMNYQYMNYPKNQPMQHYIQGDSNGQIVYNNPNVNPQFGNFNEIYNNGVYPANNHPIPDINQNIQDSYQNVYGIQSISPTINASNSQSQNYPPNFNPQGQFPFPVDHNVPTFMENHGTISENSNLDQRTVGINSPVVTEPSQTKIQQQGYYYQSDQIQYYVKDPQNENMNGSANYVSQPSGNHRQMYYQINQQQSLNGSSGAPPNSTMQENQSAQIQTQYSPPENNNPNNGPNYTPGDYHPHVVQYAN
ncbi:Polyadenylate-binding protein-interacting protein 4 [Smittium mucronatum]|uniref:Polyadenylate-binding protein-interacting protein 4 n=1 Tax=Smittium mucronatum TaxID=133383 RepID=A0A1R0GP23_9FUNG|nr:Polyadenylate-binding protein-interacting protein 4 [Smittium mucronatum]